MISVNKHMLVGGIAGGGLGGLAGYSPKTRLNHETGKKRRLSKKERITSGVATGLLGAGHGAMLGRSIGQARHLFAARGGSVPKMFSGVKTRAEAKKKFRDLAFSAHPDRAGGNEEKMKELNQAWKNFQKHPKFPKTAMAAFADELMQIWRR